MWGNLLQRLSTRSVLEKGPPHFPSTVLYVMPFHEAPGATSEAPGMSFLQEGSLRSLGSV